MILFVITTQWIIFGCFWFVSWSTTFTASAIMTEVDTMGPTPELPLGPFLGLLVGCTCWVGVA